METRNPGHSSSVTEQPPTSSRASRTRSCGPRGQVSSGDEPVMPAPDDDYVIARCHGVLLWTAEFHCRWICRATGRGEAR